MWLAQTIKNRENCQRQEVKLTGVQTHQEIQIKIGHVSGLNNNMFKLKSFRALYDANNFSNTSWI